MKVKVNLNRDYLVIFIEIDSHRISWLIENAFVEYEEVYEGTYYGTLNSEIKRLWKEGKHVLFDIDVVGGLNIKKKFPENTLAIFVQPPSIKELEKRLRKRATENEVKIQQRLDKSARELAFSKNFDVILINDDLNEANFSKYQQEITMEFQQFDVQNRCCALG